MFRLESSQPNNSNFISTEPAGVTPGGPICAAGSAKSSIAIGVGFAYDTSHLAPFPEQAFAVPRADEPARNGRLGGYIAAG